MELSTQLNIRPGVTAVIGSGGKTSLLRTLGEELAAQGKRVILTTSTHIFPFTGMPCIWGADEGETAAALENSRLICCGTPEEKTGKLTAPGLPLSALTKIADYVIVEADGSKGLPLKAHGPHEPVIPRESETVICVVGLSGLGKPLREVCHRPELYAWLAGAEESDIVTAETAAAVLNTENLGTVYVINQADTPQQEAEAKRLGRMLRKPCFIGSIRERRLKCLL